MTTRRALFGYLLGGMGAATGLVAWRTGLRDRRADVVHIKSVPMAKLDTTG